MEIKQKVLAASSECFYLGGHTHRILETIDRYPNSLLSTIEITEADVLDILKQLKPYKLPGLEGVHPSVLKECAGALTRLLKILFCKTLEEGQIPKDWKDANVMPVFKKGSRSEVSNYCPISLTSVCCKVMEKLVRNAVPEHMISNGFLSDNQHGFVHGRSCTTQLLKVIDKWTEIIDEGGAVDAVYLDFAKAFDTVPHERLLVKLASCGIQGQVLQWIQSFLREHRQRVGVAGSFSSWIDVLSGVPRVLFWDQFFLSATLVTCWSKWHHVFICMQMTPKSSGV